MWHMDMASGHNGDGLGLDQGIFSSLYDSLISWMMALRTQWSLWATSNSGYSVILRFNEQLLHFSVSPPKNIRTPYVTLLFSQQLTNAERLGSAHECTLLLYGVDFRKGFQGPILSLRTLCKSGVTPVKLIDAAWCWAHPDKRIRPSKL